MFYHTYPILVFAIDVSSFLNKALHCVPKAFLSCNMQGSLLIEKKKKRFGGLCKLVLLKPVYVSIRTVTYGLMEWYSRTVLPVFTLATVIGVSITCVALSPADSCCNGYSISVFISA